jgi:UDP-3-O-[3-hydroxymyristoyl] glucosamine N-acyltransferase
MGLNRSNPAGAQGATVMQPIELGKILEFLGDVVVTVVGPMKRVVTHAAPIHEAQDELAITFSKRADAKSLGLIRSTRAGVVLCPTETPVSEFADTGKTLVAVATPRLSFLRLVQTHFINPKPRGIHPTAVIDPQAKIEDDVYIGPFTYVGGECEIGRGTVIYGHVHIYPKTRIGRNVVVHAGTVIGADGFGYHRNEDGELEKFPHIGGVIIGDDVEIGANTCIDRGALGNTIIHKGAKVDNLVHIAHNVVVGHHAAVIAHAMVGGSTQIGDQAWVAPSACLRNGISVGDGAVVGLGAVVVKDVADGTTVMGVPARPDGEYKTFLRKMKEMAMVIDDPPQ